MQPVICLMGPTASGKTELSLQLASDLAGEIISVDSVMVYKTMDIGTAKPSQEIREQISHHLIDVRDPSQAYSAAAFVQDATKLMPLIQARGKVVILVGGTMLYFKALQQGLSFLPPADEKVRDDLNQEAQQIGWSQMHEKLRLVDPKSAQRIPPGDSQRIQRALEVYLITGLPLSRLWQMPNQFPSPFSFINLALFPEDRSALNKRIADRFEQMLEQGFVEEVRMLYERGDLQDDFPSIRSVGYRQVWQYFDNVLTYPEMKEKAVVATRQLAKRQFTWLRHWPSITYFDSLSPQIYSKLLQFILKLPAFVQGNQG